MDNVDTNQVIEYVRWSVELPLRESEAENVFGSKIELTRLHRSLDARTGYETVDTSLFTNGVIQCDTILFGIDVSIGCEPDLFTVAGMSRGEKSQLDWGTPTWRIAENMLRGYEMMVWFDQRFMLTRGKLDEIAGIEPFVRPEGAVVATRPIIDRVNLREEFSTKVTEATIVAAPPVPVRRARRFTQPAYIEQGHMLQISLTCISDSIRREILRHAVRSASYLPGGRLTFTMNLIGVEDARRLRPKTINGVDVMYFRHGWPIDGA